jgi:ATP-binding cassette, subfamily B, bacterial
VPTRSEESPLKFTAKLFFEKKFLAIWIFIGIIIHQSLRFLIPVWLGLFIDEGIESGLTQRAQMYAILILITGLTSAFFDLTMSWGNEISANYVETRSRSLFFNSIVNKRQAFHDKTQLGEQMAIAQNDLRALYQAIAPGLRLFGEGLVSIIAIILYIIFESLVLGLFLLIQLPVWWWSIVNFNNRLTPKSVAQQENFRSLSAKVKENLGAASIIRAYNQEFREIDEFNSSNYEFTNSWINRGKTLALYTPLLVVYFMSGLMFITAVYLAITPEVILFGVQLQAASNQLTVGGVATIVTLMIMLRGPTQFMQATLEFSSLGFAGISKIQDTISDVLEELPVAENAVVKDIVGDVEFSNVSFKYDSKSSYNILDNISFKVKSGESLAIIGSTGSGKSTLIKLLTRLYDISTGSITIDGINIKDFDPNTFRSEIGIVEQDVFLFSKSIADNITYPIDGQVSEDILIRAAKLAQAHDFIMELPQRYNTLVGERGVRVSGGQKQRLAIARAFISDPKILILDDATSAVDAKTEAELMTAIKNVMEGRTTFLITTRLNLIKQADNILVLDEGRVVGFGKHEDLIRENLIYRRIFGPHTVLPKLADIKSKVKESL